MNRLKFSRLTIITFLTLAFAFAAINAQPGVGAPYGARDPRVCTDTKKPQRGGPSAVIAKQYVICGLEHVTGGNTLYLVENVEVQVGGATPYNPNSFPYASDIDTKSPVYPVRASFDQYQCGREYKNPSHPLYNLKTNCTIYRIPKSTGYCLKTTFADWRCSITSREDDASPPKRQMPPPKGAGGGATAMVTETADAPAAAAGEDKPAAQYPTPDTKEMENWYSVVKFEYDVAVGKLNIFVKSKVQTHPNSFTVKFLDADGTIIADNYLCCPSPSVFSVVGNTEKLTVNTPSEANMERIKSVLVSRNKN